MLRNSNCNTENENDSGGEIIGEWLKTTPQRCHYFTSSIAPFDLIFPHDPSHILPRCLLDSRVESKWFSGDASNIIVKCLVYSPWFPSTHRCCHLVKLGCPIEPPFMLSWYPFDTSWCHHIYPIDALFIRGGFSAVFTEAMIFILRFHDIPSVLVIIFTQR